MPYGDDGCSNIFFEFFVFPCNFDDCSTLNYDVRNMFVSWQCRTLIVSLMEPWRGLLFKKYGWTLVFSSQMTWPAKKSCLFFSFFQCYYAILCADMAPKITHAYLDELQNKAVCLPSFLLWCLIIEFSNKFVCMLLLHVRTKNSYSVVSASKTCSSTQKL